MAVFCTRCGTEARDDDAFCARCGRPLAGPPFVAETTEAAPPMVPPPSVAKPSARASGAAISPSSEAAVRLGDATFELARFGRRFAGFAVDVLVVALLSFAAGIVTVFAVSVDEIRAHSELSQSELERRVEARAESTEFTVATVGMWGLLAGVYLLVGDMTGVTLGKKAVGVRALRSDGRRPGVARGLARGLAGLVGFSALLLGYMWALWDDERQTWHDKVAGTHVVRG